VNGTFTGGRTGLIGRNGSGKSTLLRLIAGRLVPSRGRVDVVGEVGYLPQTLTVDPGTTVAGLLGIDGVLAAIRAVEGGDVDERHFDATGDDCDIEARADEALDRIGFAAADLDRRVAEVSGGEAMLIAVTGLRLRRTPKARPPEPSGTNASGSPWPGCSWPSRRPDC
jgi:ATPase subunit of ABC transporter with duplicated ATPase domains